MNTIINKYKVYFILGLISLVYLLYTFTAEGVLDSGDGIKHFLISRYSYKHPELLLDHWGKPLYTLLSSPFTQFGFKGLMIFNIILGLITSFFTYKIAKKFNLEYSLFVMIFVCFCPVYFETILSGLTEILFSTLLVISIYLIIIRKYIFASLLISFLPFVRSEAYLILPMFLIVLGLRKQFIAIPFLAVGYILYSVIGYFYYDDIFWINNLNPYQPGPSVYGKGELLHFINYYDKLLGIPLTILFIPGVIYWCIRFFKRLKNKQEQLFIELFLISGSFFIVFIFHSYVWWKGIWSSAGLIRVIASVIPLACIFCIYGLELFSVMVRRNKLIIYIFFGLITFFTIQTALLHISFPIKDGMEQKVLTEAGDWFKKSEYRNNKIYYMGSFLGYRLGTDPFDNDVANTNKHDYQRYIPDNAIVFWDGHYSAKEGKTPLKKFLDNNRFELLKTFIPERPFTVYGTSFEVYVFRKNEDHTGSDEERILYYEDFEVKPLGNDSIFFTDQQARSGKYSYKIDGTKEFLNSVSIQVNEFPKNELIQVQVNISLFTKVDPKTNPLLLVFSVFNNESQYFYKALNLENENIELDKWNTITLDCVMPEIKSPDDIMKVYFWHRGNDVVFLDDYIIKEII